MMRKLLIVPMIIIVLFTVGCNSKKTVTFKDLVQDEVVKINMRHPGSGVLYSTTDKELIKRFITVMEDKGGDYYKSSAVGIAGNSIYRLYNVEDVEDVEVARISFVDEGMVEINGEIYNAKTDVGGILKSFFEKFASDENIVKE